MKNLAPLHTDAVVYPNGTIRGLVTAPEDNGAHAAVVLAPDWNAFIRLLHMLPQHEVDTMQISVYTIHDYKTHLLLEMTHAGTVN